MYLLNPKYLCLMQRKGFSFEGQSIFTGIDVHYSLMELGIKNITVNAAGVPATQKEALMKTDKAGAAKPARALEAGLLYPAFVPV
ncbi:hypothetical protein FACS1894181_02970 [Bacteroidia bacterium]|nr:hypothetical protein FACS1894181_02970 [Bacteroidia bacterium]